MFEACGRNWLQCKEWFILRKKEFLVDSMPQECKAPVLSGPESSCPAHYLLLQVRWVERHGTVTFVRKVIFPGEVIGAAKEEF